jgi:CHAT domain-containing protein
MHIHRKFSIYLSLALFLFSLIFCIWLGNIASAQFSNPSQSVQKGVELYQVGDYRGAIAQWETALNNYKTEKQPTNTVIVQENLARAYTQIGQFDKAISYWEQTISNYRQLGDVRQVGRMLSEQAQAYMQLGQNRRAIALLCGSKNECLAGTALNIARQEKDSLGQVAALGSLGEAYRLRGEYDRAIEYLESAKKIDRSLHSFSLLNSLGNAYSARSQRWDIRTQSASARGEDFEVIARRFARLANNDYQKAWQYFESSQQQATEREDPSAQMRSLLNLIQLDARSQKQNLNAEGAIASALNLLARLPNSPQKINAAIDLANLSADSQNITAPLAQCPTQRKLSDAKTEDLLKQALKIARTIKDSRSESFALGALGHFQECDRQYETALKFTQEALLAADQNTSNKDSVYLWEWQTGRILRAQGKQRIAIAAYQRSFDILEQIRSDILVSERDVQFDFRDAIEPVYRQLAQLRLRLASLSSVKSEEKERELTSALETIDSLRLAELQNYFGNECSLAFLGENVQQPLPKDTAVFSSIILEDSTAILLSLPNGEKRVRAIEQNRKTVEDEIKTFREGLIYGRREIIYDTTQAKKLYDWFVKPFEVDLNSAKIKTLVFIQDGIFRTIPMSALYDGKGFLIEKYAIATTPSLRLISAQKSNSQNRALILGVTKAANVDEQKFDALVNVPTEIQDVRALFPENKLLIDEQFNRENLETELDRSTYKIVHIATHAQFGFIPEDTFLVAGNNKKIAINELETALRQLGDGTNSVDLLTLTACQTAAGDERAALGLAGIAVQTGVKSALASLWSVPDESTLALVTEFYKNLVNSSVNKAEALRISQLKLIKAKESEDINDQYDNPAYWAPFILIGNWT